MKYISIAVLMTFLVITGSQEVSAKENRKDIPVAIVKKLQKSGIGVTYDEERKELKLISDVPLPVKEFANKVRKAAVSEEMKFSAIEIKDPINGIDAVSDKGRDAYINSWHDAGFIVADIQIRNGEHNRVIMLLAGDYESLDTLVKRVTRVDPGVFCSGAWFKPMSVVPKNGPRYLPQPGDWVYHY